MKKAPAVDRREFLKLLSLGGIALGIPPGAFDFVDSPAKYPSLPLNVLPSSLQRVLLQVPVTAVDQNGYLHLREKDSPSLAQIPVARTQWNLENSNPVDRLYPHIPWGIVLHWYGDKENFDRSIAGYLRGFNDLREINGIWTRTSAHFLVGDATPEPQEVWEERGNSIGIIQTQIPDKDGTPFSASHLQPLDIEAHKDRRQYFVRAYYTLGFHEPAVHSLLQDLFDGPRIDPNMRTIAIEIAGYDFDRPDTAPSNQKIANTLSVVLALMLRYEIPANHILGHHEIHLNKSDPGKKFMAIIRFLVGMQALVGSSDRLKQLVFGSFLRADNSPKQAVLKYFECVRDYLVSVGTPKTVYDWENWTKHWLLLDYLVDENSASSLANRYREPILEKVDYRGYKFLEPINHEGIDMYARSSRALHPISQTGVHLIAPGICLYLGESTNCAQGKIAMFRHRGSDGGELLSVYGHLSQISNIEVGKRYSLGYPVGAVSSGTDDCNGFLHFALAYGATWETNLRFQPSIPPNAEASWIHDRYLDPIDFLSRHVNSVPERKGSTTYE